MRLNVFQNDQQTRNRRVKMCLFFCLALSINDAFAPKCAFASELLNKGIAAYSAGDYSQSVQFLKEAKKRDFENATLHYYLGSALVKLKRSQEAVLEYKLALDLNPEGKLADYCRAALAVLAGPPVKVSETKEQLSAPAKFEKIEQPAAQQPIIYAYLDGSPASDRALPILSDLHTIYGDKLNFVRSYKGAERSSALASRYSITEYPTVLLFDSQGKMYKKFERMFSEELLRKDVAALVPTTNLTRLSDTEDKSLAMSRKAIVDEYNARVSAGRRQIDEALKQARREAESELLSRRSLRNEQAIQDSVEARALSKTSELRQEFEKRKREWYLDVMKRLQGLGIKSSSTDIAPPVEGAD